MTSDPEEDAMSQVVVTTGASSGFGATSARERARAGHTVHTGIRDTGGRRIRLDDLLRPRRRLQG